MTYSNLHLHDSPRIVIQLVITLIAIRLLDSVFIFVSICVVSMSAVCNITYLGIVAVSFQSNVNVYGPYWIYSTVRMSASTIVYSNKFSNRMKPSKFIFNETTNGMFVANVLYICCFFFKLLSLRCHFHKYKYRPCIKTSFVLLAELVSFSLVFRSFFPIFSSFRSFLFPSISISKCSQFYFVCVFAKKIITIFNKTLCKYFSGLLKENFSADVNTMLFTQR